LDSQRWTIAPIGGYYKVANLATGDAIGLPAGASGVAVVELAAYTGADGQLWSLDQFPDGSYRIRNKAAGLALGSAKDGNGLVATSFVRDDMHLWTITTP
jgi:arabinan endo-1,5-alpha-L-arabinosidase